MWHWVKCVNCFLGIEQVIVTQLLWTQPIFLYTTLASVKYIFSYLLGKNHGSKFLSSCSHSSWILTHSWRNGDVSSAVSLPVAVYAHQQNRTECGKKSSFPLETSAIIFCLRGKGIVGEFVELKLNHSKKEESYIIHHIFWSIPLNTFLLTHISFMSDSNEMCTAKNIIQITMVIPVFCCR